MEDKTLDATARANGATHKDKRAKNRYYKISHLTNHCEACNIKIGERITWKYFGRKLPVTAVEL